MGLETVGYVALSATGINLVQRLVFAQLLTGLRLTDWVRHVALPLVSLGLTGLVASSVLRFSIGPSFGRVCLTTVSAELAMLPFAWFVVIDAAERAYVCEKISKITSHFRKREG